LSVAGEPAPQAREASAIIAADARGIRLKNRLNGLNASWFDFNSKPFPGGCSRRTCGRIDRAFGGIRLAGRANGFDANQTSGERRREFDDVRRPLSGSQVHRRKQREQRRWRDSQEPVPGRGNESPWSTRKPATFHDAGTPSIAWHVRRGAFSLPSDAWRSICDMAAMLAVPDRGVLLTSSPTPVTGIPHRTSPQSFSAQAISPGCSVGKGVP
jgi:hypothetical protein